MWRTPVYDRTPEDVEQRRPKGCCNVEDLNRLEQNCAELAGLIGVRITPRAEGDWTALDFPTGSQLARIAANVGLLRKGYNCYQDTPISPAHPLNQYQKWNAAEKILADIYYLWHDRLAALWHCGEIVAGQGIGVI